jgi:class 3 adenylate cyclase/predicted metal-dependent HD superfamily phosphohydrolase
MLNPTKSIIATITFLLILLVSPVFSQYNPLGVPKITNFESKDYGYESQNFNIIQSKSGLIYFSNTNGIIEHDNNTWNIIHTKGTPCMDIDCYERIFIGGFNEFGYLNESKTGTKLISLLENDSCKFGQINKIISLCGETYFTTDTCVFQYKNNKLKCFLHGTQSYDIFKVAGSLYIYMPEKGLFNLKNETLEKVIDYENFRNSKFLDICIFNGKIIFKPQRTTGLFNIKNNKVNRFDTNIDKLLEKGMVTKLLNYNNKYLIVGTEVNGLFILDKKGKLVFHLNKSSGLADNYISDIYIDNNQQLWVTTYNGLSYVELSSPFTYYSSDKSLNISILSIEKHEDKIFFSTNQGAYYFDEISDDKDLFYDNYISVFKKIKDLNLRVKDLVSFGNYLYACTDYGLYLIKNNDAELLQDGNFETILKSKFFHNQVYITNSNGLLLAEQESDGNIKTIGYIENLDYSTRTIAEDKNGRIWLGSNNNGIFRIDFTKSHELSPQFVHIQRGYGLPDNYDWIDVYKTKEGIVFSTYDGTFNFNDSSLFVPDNKINLTTSDIRHWIFPLYEDNLGNLWFSSGVKDSYKKKTGVSSYNSENNTYNIVTKPFQSISDRTIECILEENNTTWFGSINGLIRYKPVSINTINTRVPCVLRHISITNDTVLMDNAVYTKNIENASPHIFKHHQKNIRFEFTIPYYQARNETQYQTKLKGLQNKWADWTTENFKEYTNLKTGDYIFMVKAKSPYNDESKSTCFKFSIRPPIYLAWWSFIVYFIFSFSSISMLFRRREYKHLKEKYRLESIIASRTEELLKQKEQTERLVNRILPKTTVEEIKANGKASSKRFEMATVLFADIQGFTKITEEIDPEQLIKLLDKIFKSFDQIIEKYEIEKIKTIGDAYMCAGGIPTPNSTNPIEISLAALEMQHAISRIRKEEEIDFQVRIGVHTGPLVAGVVGSQKITYDIWGDTVNIASRMETHGEVAQVNISSTTYSHIRDFFHCMYRGKHAVKYKGDLDMYYIKGIHSELTKNLEKLQPNHEFIVKLQVVRLQDIQKDILEKLEKNLPKNLYYHNLKHTVNVFYQTEMIGRAEGVTEEQLLLLKTAALLHDIGFLVSYDHHEEKGVEIAKNILATYHYSSDQISIINKLILATKYPQKPQNLLQQIICDADLDYLGRPDFIPTSQNLFRELFERNKIDTIEQWNKMQIKFMEKHRYFTATARRYREPEKQKRQAELKKML